MNLPEEGNIYSSIYRKETPLFASKQLHILDVSAQENAFLGRKQLPSGGMIFEGDRLADKLNRYVVTLSPEVSGPGKDAIEARLNSVDDETAAEASEYFTSWLELHQVQVAKTNEAWIRFGDPKHGYLIITHSGLTITPKNVPSRFSNDGKTTTFEILLSKPIEIDPDHPPILSTVGIQFPSNTPIKKICTPIQNHFESGVSNENFVRKNVNCVMRLIYKEDPILEEFIV